jgi:CubicO group peptidase (beta-lactamase class C family)
MKLTNHLTEFFDTLLKDGLSWRPGDKLAYSDVAYILLGYALERVTGQQYVDIIHDKILQPLGMQNTGFEVPKASDSLIPLDTTWFDINFGNYNP